MKILLLNQAFYPDPVATAQHLTDLAIYLKDRGHEVTVLTGQRDYERRSVKYPSSERYQGIRIFRAPSTGYGKKSFLHRAADAVTFELSMLWRLLRISKHDLVVSFTSPPLIGVVGSVYCRVRGGRSVQWLMDLNPDLAIEMGFLKKGAPATRLLTMLFEASLEWSDHIVVLDRWMKSKVIEHGGDGSKITIVPPWPVQALSEPVAGERASRNPFRKRHGLEGKFVVLYSGNHSIVHPLDTLLAAAVRLKDDDQIRFVFVGGGLRVKDVARAREKNGLCNVIQLPHQPRERLSDSLSAADLHVVVMGERVSGLVHTSKVYGILAAGCPYVFIGPRESHVTDLQRECPYGYHVEHGEVNSLVEVIQGARRLSLSEKSEIGRKNFDHVIARYTSEKCLESFSTDVLGGPPAG